MDRFRKQFVVAPTLLLLLVIALGRVAFGTWLPLLGCLPWLVAIVWLSRGAHVSREFPSLSEASRERLWAR
jgi:predicted Na+-dependent transporter